ncbi:MAG: TVP38/TMEM64 family protein [Clostridia bacterium]|nr:TVP38/TMEM64 family protein [Clostridia bacterium]
MDSQRKEKITNILVNSVGIVIFLVIAAVITVALWPYISEFLESPEKLQSFVADNGALAVPLYLALQVLQVVVALIPGEALEIGAGAAFGWFWGLILAEIGVALGTVIIFVVARKAGRRFVDAIVGGKKLKVFDKLNTHPRRDSVIFLVFLIPALPKDLLTYAAAFFDISMWKFILMTAIARIPSIITSTLAADFLIEGNYLAAVLIFVATGAMAIICFLLSEKIMAKIGVKKSEE